MPLTAECQYISMTHKSYKLTVPGRDSKAPRLCHFQDFSACEREQQRNISLSYICNRTPLATVDFEEVSSTSQLPKMHLRPERVTKSRDI